MARESKGEQEYSEEVVEDVEEVRERREGRKHGNQFSSFYLSAMWLNPISGITFCSCPVMNDFMCGNKIYPYIAF